jgi:succinate-semialdehyde dehydrogenase/glutarate-semialdehyde dehydrogenase
VACFDSIDDAIDRANDTEYGLAAIVYSSNIHTVKRCVMEINAGNVAVNNVDAGVINAPYGGWKASGFGREHGSEGLFEYLQSKHVRIKA